MSSASLTDPLAPPSDHNNPPKTIRERIEATYKTVLDRMTELKASCEKAPSKIADGDDKTAGEVADLLKLVRVAIKAADGARSEEKEPFLAAGKEVDSIFKVPMETLTKASATASAALTAYLERKKEAERLAREATARAAAKAAEEAAREKAQAEERARQAEEAAREASDKRREAQENRDEAEQRKLNAEAELAASKAARATARRDKNDAALATAEERINAAHDELLAAKAELVDHRAKERAARDEADKKARAEAAAQREQEAAASAAERTERHANRTDKRANAGVADLSRTRSEGLGTVTSLAKHWTYTIQDRQEIPMAQLWPFFSETEIDAAVARAVSAGVRQMPGVNIFEDLNKRVM